MITPTLIYWISTLDSFIKLVAVFFSIMIAVMLWLIVGIMCNSDCGNEKKARAFYCRWFKVLLPLTVAFSVILVFVPSSRTVAAMYVVPAIANSEKVQDVGNRLYDLAVEWMKQLGPKKNGEVRHEK